jgi:ethanolaminephosphotransferase
VDNNVTRHIKPELEKDDWDGLIFHYLGLDHVGHSGGPKSNLMRPKQAEMDSVAHTIYTTLVRKESSTENQRDELPTLFILCGDHGMNEVHIIIWQQSNGKLEFKQYIDESHTTQHFFFA